MPAKKYGRNRRPARARATASQAVASPQARAAPAAPGRPVAARTPPVPAGTYPYIGGELKVIGILTAVVMAVLIILALVLR